MVAIVAIIALVAAVGVGSTAGVLAYGSSCDLDSLRRTEIGANSFVYAANGSLLGSIPAEKNREPVTAADMSLWVRKATIAVEDRRFFEHGGIDVEGIARAAVADIKAGSLVEGGSTITQQLVRNLYISREKTVQRKVKEACLASKLDGEWSKQRILTEYLNQSFFGNRAYGIEAASQTYFSKPARDLTLAESALLAGLPQAPSSYDPFTAPARALARQREVLAAMLDTRVITPRIYRKALAAKVVLHRGRLYDAIREPYFFGYVRDKLIEAYGAQQVRSGGLKVYTTIIPRYQRLAETAIKETLDESDDPASALISISPRTGAIRAMAAVVPNRPKNQFNLLSQARRQPGSTFKTFVLTAAVEQGINPDSTYYVSAPFTYKIHPAGNCEDGTWWCVKTYANDYYGWSSIRSATLRSDNTVYAQLTLDVGPEKVADVARRMGVRSQLDVNGAYVPAIGLGSIAVSPLDLASSYATLAAGGVHAEPMAIRRVVLPDGSGRHGSRLGQAETTSRDLGGYGGRRHTHPRAERPVGNGHARRFRPSGGREDRNRRGERRRVVRRVHARARDDGVDRLHERGDPARERPWHRGDRRQLPGRDLAAFHGARARGYGARGVPRTEGVAGVDAVHAR